MDLEYDMYVDTESRVFLTIIYAVDCSHFHLKLNQLLHDSEL